MSRKEWNHAKLINFDKDGNLQLIDTWSDRLTAPPKPKGLNMKWSYTVVQYAILNEEWIKEHGDHWAAGRIECWHYEDMAGWGYYPVHEIGFVVHVDDFKDFVYTVEQMRTEKLIDLKELDFRFHT